MEDLAMANWKESIFAMQIMFSELRCPGKKISRMKLIVSKNTK